MGIIQLLEIKKRLDQEFGSPREVMALLSGDTGKRLEKILSLMMKLSNNGSGDTVELLKLVKDLAHDGTLEKLEKILMLLPKGKDGRMMVMEIRRLATEMGPKLDKLTAIAGALLGEDKP